MSTAAPSLTLTEAARLRDIQAMRQAMPRETPKMLRAIGALEECARQGYLEGVEFLVTVVNALDYRGQAIRAAAERGFVECLQAMLPPAPTTPFSEAQTVLLSEPIRTLAVAMVEAAWEGHLSCVQALLPHAGHGTMHRAQAIEKAAIQGHQACLDALWTTEAAALAFQMCHSAKRWQGVDALLDAVDPGVWRVVHAQARAAGAALPRIEARLLHMDLNAALPSDSPPALTRVRV